MKIATIPLERAATPLGEPSVQGPAGKPAESHAALEGTSAPIKGYAPCPECLCQFRRKVPGQLFCTPEHRDRWNNRQSVRGRVLTPLSVVAHITRSGTRIDPDTGKRAAHEMRTLITRWRDEDRAAGRMEWAGYLRLRYAAGFDPLG